MSDPVFNSFLEVQYQELMALAAQSDILRFECESVTPPRRYVLEFKCGGLIRAPSGEIQEASRFLVGISLPDDFLRTPDTQQIVTIIAPWIWHPNAAGPFLCLGNLTGGTPLVDVVFQVYEILTYQKWSAHDGLNSAAAEWARNNQRLFPIDRRPLKWKRGGTQP
jgi:hypothetical protein